MNPAFENALASAETSPQRLADLVCPEERDEIANLAEEVIAARRDCFRLEAARGGSNDRSEWTAWRMKDGGSACLLLVEDLPDKDGQADERLQQRQRWEAVGRLAGGVFHDFNNLLTGVTLYSDLLLAGLEADNRLRRYADEIRSASMHAAGLIRQLLALARQGVPSPQLLSLNEVVGGMQSLLCHLIGENIDLRYRLAPDLGLVTVDLAQAQQILLNLVLNSRDALQSGGGIIVETSNCRFQSLTGTVLAESGGPAFPCILLVVADNGHGMGAETRQRLFEPFFTTKSPGKGNGLGLTTVHNIVARNGGLIHVDSEPGRGTRMMILFPRAAETAAADSREMAKPDPETSTQRLQANEKERIL